MTSTPAIDAERHNDEGKARAARGDMAGAAEAFRAAIDADPSLAKAHSNLASALRRLGRRDEAEAAYRRALELGGSALARRNLAVLLAEARRDAEAFELGAGRPASERAELAAAIADVALAAGDVTRAGAAWIAVKEADPAHARLGEGLAKTTLELPFGPGLRCVVPDDRSLITPYVLEEQGDWFEDELRFVRKALGPGDTAVDVGANFGVYALSMAAAVGPTGRVVAFEPATTTHRFACESRDRLGFGWLDVERRALSDRRGKATFHHAGSPELSSLHAGSDAGESTEEVAVGVLDDVLEVLGDRRVALIKLDAEGEEVRILEGARRLLREHEPLLLVELRHAGTFNRPLVAKLEQLGLVGHQLAPGPLVLVPMSPKDYAASYALNVFACSPRCAERLRARGLVARPATPDASSASDPRAAARARAARPATMRPSADLEAIAMDLHLAAAEADVDHRVGRLARAFGRAMAIGVDSPSIGGACATARAAAELGRRDEAVRAAEWALHELDHGAEPVDVAIAPVARFDDEPVRTTPRAWVEAAVLELLLLRAGYSSLFNPALVPLAERSLASPHPAERARGVMRARAR